MTLSAKSILVFGIYLYLVGLTLIFIPNMFLHTLSVAETREPWIRVVGVIVVVLGYYYHQMSKTGFIPFFRLTIPVRVCVFISFVGLIILKMLGPVFILISFLDVAGAAWTYFALKKEKGD